MLILHIGTILFTCLFALLLLAAFSPIESLGWWAGWFGDNDIIDELKDFIKPSYEGNREVYVVYLSGIGMTFDTHIPPEEVAFLDYIKQRVPNVHIIENIFPYHVHAMKFRERRLVPKNERLQKSKIMQSIVGLRNIFFVLISSDKRYGPIYNLGVAKKILYALKNHGYVFGSRSPVILIGSSGGVQIAIGVSTYLQRILKNEIKIISIGGIFADDPGFTYIKKFYHLYGSRDYLITLDTLFFLGRWPMFTSSFWNKARHTGIVDPNCLGPFKHLGKRGYFDNETLYTEGKSYLVKMADTVVDILSSQ